jgi:transcriptional regulator with XRE-family HTH domain
MEEAAQKAGFAGRQRWNAIESGHRKDPSASTVQAVAKALGCRMDELMVQESGAPAKKAKPKGKAKG